MKNILLRSSRRAIALLLAASLALAMGGAMFADDAEKPIDFDAPGAALPIFGDTTLQPVDLTGSLLDTKDAMEPQITAQLTMGDITGLSDAAANVATVPTFSVQP